MIRGVVLWTIWLERNRLCFQGGFCESLKSVDNVIITSAKFWCAVRKDGSILKLFLILPDNTLDLPLQINPVQPIIERRH